MKWLVITAEKCGRLAGCVETESVVSFQMV